MTKKTMQTLFSSGNDEWQTPKWLYQWFMDLGYKDINPINCGYDALSVEWFDKTFCNPPYSKKLLKLFIDKAMEEANKGKEIILLIPSRTDTHYFDRLLNLSPLIVFVHGRLKFNETGSAPFPSLIIRLKRGQASHWLKFKDFSKLLERGYL